MTATKHLDYRPAIDGLRAIAVLSVFAFHLNHHWMSGGFAGVDVFFVISGYLITSIIYKGCKADSFNLAAFYQRRIARIAPAFFLVALCTMGFSACFYQPQDLQQAGASMLSASLSMLNISLMHGRNYFTVSPDAAPFTHYWPLSVEEQYYIIFPILLWLLFKFCRRYLVSTLGLICTLSFFACIYLTARHPTYAFYLLPTRAWELCSGGLLAVLVIDNNVPSAKISSHVVSIAGLLVLISSMVMLRDSSLFPGWIAAFPVIAILAILWASSDSSPVEKMLSHPVLVYVGKRSYSLYLWHWPIFAFVDYTLFAYSNFARLPIKIGASFLLAEASYSLVENPSRQFFNRVSNRKLAYIFLGCALLVTIQIGQYYKSRAYVNARPSDLAKGGLFILWIRRKER